MPWSCRTCTVSLQASGQHPGLTFSTDLLPPAQGAKRKLESPSSFNPRPIRTSSGSHHGARLALQLKAVSQSTLPLSAPPISAIQLSQTKNLCSCLIYGNISLKSAGKVTRGNHLFMTKDKTRQIVPGMLHPIRVAFKQFTRTCVEWVSSWRFKPGSLQLTCSPWGTD